MSETVARVRSRSWLRCSDASPTSPSPRHGADYQTKMDFARLEQAHPLTRAHLRRSPPEPGEPDPGGDRPGLRAAHRGAHPRRALRGHLLLRAGAAASSACPRCWAGSRARWWTSSSSVLERLGGQHVGGQGLLPGRAPAAQHDPEPAVACDLLLQKLGVDTGKLGTDRGRGQRSAGCSSRPASTAGRACSTAGASRSSSTTRSRDEIPGYQAGIDRLGGRDGAQIRDEIRMVRPGLLPGPRLPGRGSSP